MQMRKKIRKAAARQRPGEQQPKPKPLHHPVIMDEEDLVRHEVRIRTEGRVR